MAKGAIAKTEVENKIRNAFGKDFIGVDTSNKKLYVQAEEDGEMIQVAITMTCPKTPFMPENGLNFNNDNSNFGEPDTFQPAEVSSVELDNIRKMIQELGL